MGTADEYLGFAFAREDMSPVQPGELLPAETILDGLPAFVQVADSKTHEVLYLNRLARDRFGDGVGRRCWEVFRAGAEGPCCPVEGLPEGADQSTCIRQVDPQGSRGDSWLECRTQRLRWPDGRSLRVHIATDITTRKCLEDGLWLAARAFETAEGILITDRRGTIVKVNDAFTQITGHEAAQAVGTSLWLLNSTDHNDPFLKQRVLRALAGSGHWSGEVWYRHPGGAINPLWLGITAVRDGDQEIHYVGHFHDISERKRRDAEMAHQALHDPLTDLPNRRLLYDRLEQRVREIQRYGSLGGLLFLDLDNLKAINDQHGHALGDAILQEVARRLVDALRREDTAARLGGDEFVALLGHLGTDRQLARDHLLQVAHKIHSRLLHPAFLNGQHLRVTASIGATLFPGAAGDPDLDAEAIIHRADQAMYQAKRAGKNQIRYGPE